MFLYRLRKKKHFKSQLYVQRRGLWKDTVINAHQKEIENQKQIIEEHSSNRAKLNEIIMKKKLSLIIYKKNY
jgi:hypothetical protein